MHRKTTRGYTPLHIAASSPAVKTMLAFSQRGAKVTETTNSGATPLHVACAAQRPRVGEAVELLLRWGASETAVDNYGESPAGGLQRRAKRRRCSAAEAERVQVLLTRAPADREWRRRCWLVIFRARAEKEREAQRVGDSRGQVGQGGPSLLYGAQDGDGSKKIARTDDGDGNGGRTGVGRGGAASTASGAVAEEGGLGALVSMLMCLESNGVFRIIVGYL